MKIFQRISQDNPNGWRNPWVLGWISMVVIVFLINTLMVYLSFHTFPGLVNKNYYNQGENYDKVISDRRKLEASGIKLQIIGERSPRLHQATTYQLVVENAPALPSGVYAEWLIYRPADSRQDFTVTMKSSGANHYEGVVTFPLPGVWDVVANFHYETYDIHTAVKVTVIPEKP